MIFNLILIASTIFVIILSNLKIRYISSYKKGYILATSVPYDFKFDENVIDILDELKRNTSFVFKFSLPITLLILFSNTLLVKILIFLMIIILYQGVVSIFIYISMKKLRAYKKSKSFNVNVTQIKFNENLDKEKKFPQDSFYFLPLIILIPGLFFLDFYVKTSTIMFIFGAIISISLIFFSRSLKKSSSKTYYKLTSEDVKFNPSYKSQFSNRVLILNIILSLACLVLVIVNYYYPYNYLTFIIYTMLLQIGLLFVVYKEYNENSKDKINLNVSEEDFYDILGYKNKDDPRILVPSKLNIGNMDINRGRSIGKIIYYGLVIGIFALIFSLPYFLSPANYIYDIKDDELYISSKMYKDKINLGDIKEIHLLDEFPKKSIVKTNGVSLQNQSYGSFSIEKIGPIRLYYYKSGNKVILIKADKNYIINEKDDNGTTQLYEKIKSKIKARTSLAYLAALTSAQISENTLLYSPGFLNISKFLYFDKSG